MIGMETTMEIVALLTLLASDGAMSLNGAPVTTNREVKGNVTNIMLIINLYLFQDLPTSTTLMSPAAGDSLLLTSPIL